MKNKLFASLISIFCIINYTYAFKLPSELKAWGIKFAQITIWVIISICIIWVGLNIYKKYLENKLAQPEPVEKPDTQEKKVTKPKVDKKRQQNNNNFKCEIDDAKSIDEAINIFLTIDNRR